LLISESIPRSNIIDQQILQVDMECSSKTNWCGMVPPIHTSKRAARGTLLFLPYCKPAHPF